MRDAVFTARPVEMSFSLLAFGERAMDELIKRARAVSQALKEAKVPHAVIGGLAVRAYEATVQREPSLTTRVLDATMISDFPEIIRQRFQSVLEQNRSERLADLDEEIM